MPHKLLTTLLLASIAIPTASPQTRIAVKDLIVSDGEITKTRDQPFEVTTKELRATLKVAPTANQNVTLHFAYLGPTREISHLGSGEIRHQFGLKLRAQDTCNLVYVMWNFDTQKIAVSVKRNPGQRTHEDCLDHGYISNFRSTKSAAPPPLAPNEPHTLSANLSGQALTVTADDKLVWQGTLPAIIFQFQGPPGLRSDNAHVVFDFQINSLRP
jgi:hypothetical protein